MLLGLVLVLAVGLVVVIAVVRAQGRRRDGGGETQRGGGGDAPARPWVERAGELRDVKPSTTARSRHPHRHAPETWQG